MPESSEWVGSRLQNARVTAGLGATARRIAGDLPAGDGVGVVLALGFGFVAAGSNAFAESVVAAQSELQEGPALSAAVSETPVRATFSGAERRWGRFTSAAGALSLGAVLSVPVRPGAEVLGSVSVCVRDQDDLARVQESVLVDVVSAVMDELETARLLGQLSVQLYELRRAFEDRNEVEIAVGVLLARHGCSVAQARILLGRLAHHRGTSLIEAARQVVRSGPHED